VSEDNSLVFAYNETDVGAGQLVHQLANVLVSYDPHRCVLIFVVFILRPTCELNNISNEPVKEKEFFLYFWDRQIFTWAERLVYNDAGLVAQTPLIIRKRKAFVVICGTSPRADNNLNSIHYQITRKKCL
jgi:hypothetical protein